MSDMPGRSYSSDDRAGPGDEEGWGSPVPAEYGSLRSVRSTGPAADEQADGTSGPDGQDSRQDRWGVTSILRRLQDVGEAILPSSTPAPAVTNGSASEPAPARRGADPLHSPDPVKAPEPVLASAEPAGAAAPSVGWDSGIDPADLGPALTAPEMTLGPRRRRRGRRPTRVRSRATIRHLDIMTVIRVSLLFWGVVLITLVVASVLLWTFADAFGTLPSIEKSVRTLFSLKSFQLHPSTIAMYTAAGGVVIAVAGTLASIVLALIYNLIAEVVGGVRVELETFTAE